MTDKFYEEGYYHGIGKERRFSDVAKVLKQLGAGGKFLDIGCGDGDVTQYLAEAMGTKDTYGLELSEEAVKISVKKGIKASAHDVGAAPYPFEDDTFDVIYCGEIIEHVFDPEHLISEVKRVLKPTGICVITTPNLAGWPNRFALLLGYQPFPTSVSPHNEGLGKLFFKGNEGQWGHIRVFTLRALKELVTMHKLTILKVQGSIVTIDAGTSVFSRLVSVVDKIMAVFPGCSTRIILAIKK